MALVDDVAGALEGIGATVERLAGDRLLVGYQGSNHLLAIAARGRGLRWAGAPPVKVRTAAGALDAVGAPIPAIADQVAEDLPPAPPPTTFRCSGCALVYDSTQGLDAYDSNDVPLGVRPPMHWDDSKPVRPLPLCAGFDKPGVRLS